MEELIAKWDTVLSTVRTEYGLTDISYETWLKPLEVFAVQDQTLFLLYPLDTDQMSLNYISNKFTLPLKVTIAEMTGKEYNLRFLLPKDAVSLSGETLLRPASMTPDQAASYRESHLNPRYTFDTFVVGNANRFAQTASLAVAENPGESYNPLYIYGGPGLGKTHLMQSIGNFILQQNPGKKVLYATSEEFLNEVIESIRSTNNTSSMSKFREKYRTVDVLMIDDIQFIIGKESTQEEFFHTFNSLHAAGKQIILTSDKPPKDMETLEARIRSRFEWGLMADIGLPDYETRMAILSKKLERDHFSLDDEILRYIADHVKTNIRELEGALNKLIAYANLQHVPITMDIARKELENIISPDQPREITPQYIIEMVADHYQISMEKMVSKDRSAAIARPRMVAMYLCRMLTDSPLNAIGELLGGRDHTTITSGVSRISDLYTSDPELRTQVDIITKKISPHS